MTKKQSIIKWHDRWLKNELKEKYFDQEHIERYLRRTVLKILNFSNSNKKSIT